MMMGKRKEQSGCELNGQIALLPTYSGTQEQHKDIGNNVDCTLKLQHGNIHQTVNQSGIIIFVRIRLPLQ